VELYIKNGSFFSLTTFSPTGTLIQLNHALAAVSAGATAIGIKAKDGVVIVTEKKLPFLMESSTVHKVAAVTENIGIVYAGLGPDFRVLVKSARKAALKYKHVYQESIPVTELVKEVANVMQEYTQSRGVRPFGCSVLISSVDEKGPQLFQVDPSGSYFGWKASAIGAGEADCRTFLEKRYSEDMGLEDAVSNAILTLKEAFQGKMDMDNIEIGIARKTGFHVLSPKEIGEYLQHFE